MNNHAAYSIILRQELANDVKPRLGSIDHRQVTAPRHDVERNVDAVLLQSLLERPERSRQRSVPLSREKEHLLSLERLRKSREDVVALERPRTDHEPLDVRASDHIMHKRLAASSFDKLAPSGEPARNGDIREGHHAVLASEGDSLVPSSDVRSGRGRLGVAGDQARVERAVAVCEGEGGGAALRDADDGVDGSGDLESEEDDGYVVGELGQGGGVGRGRGLPKKGLSGTVRAEERESFHLAVAALVEREQVERLRKTRQNLAPHLLVRHERVDKDEPRCATVPLRNTNVKLDASLDLDDVLRLRRFRKSDGLFAHISNVESDEEARDHIVGRDDGGGLEELLIVLEVRLELVQLGLRNHDGEGGRIGKTEGGGLDGGEGCGGERQGKGGVEVADDGELRCRESSVDSNVCVVYETRKSAHKSPLSSHPSPTTSDLASSGRLDLRIHSNAAELRAATRRICASSLHQQVPHESELQLISP